MTKTLLSNSVRAPLPSREVRTLDQRLQAANEAWQDFMVVREISVAAVSGQDYLMLSAFARFLHELLPDPSLCAPLMLDFETRHLQAGVQARAAHQ